MVFDVQRADRTARETRYTLYPGGYEATSPEYVFYGGVAAGIIYVSLVMSLRPLVSFA